MVEANPRTKQDRTKMPAQVFQHVSTENQMKSGITIKSLWLNARIACVCA